MASPKKRIVSGMRPTGPLHLGHYYGTLLNWVELQKQYECFYFIADWHVLTDHHEHLDTLTRYTREMVANWIACGIDPEESTLFVQSAVPEHLELAWILGSLSTVGMLQRCPTYKDEAHKLEGKETPNYALLGYPVLQTSDIALYKGEVVPVGEDQVSHLEIGREILRKFNRLYAEIFPEPQPRLTETPRIRGTDGEKKMSKTLGNTLELGEEPGVLRKKILGMFTDPQRKKRSDPGRPELCNVFSFHGLLKNTRLATIETDCRTANIGCVECKGEMADRLLRLLEPIREKREALLARPGTIDDILRKGNERARSIARATLQEVRRAMYGGTA